MHTLLPVYCHGYRCDVCRWSSVCMPSSPSTRTIRMDQRQVDVHPAHGSAGLDPLKPWWPTRLGHQAVVCMVLQRQGAPMTGAAAGLAWSAPSSKAWNMRHTSQRALAAQRRRRAARPSAHQAAKPTWKTCWSRQLSRRAPPPALVRPALVSFADY
jgi:hypothetical protein